MERVPGITCGLLVLPRSRKDLVRGDGVSHHRIVRIEAGCDVIGAGSAPCDADLDGWYEPKGFIDVQIPSGVCSVDLHRYTIAADQLVNQAELADELAVNYQKRLAHAENEVRVYKAITRRHLRYRVDERFGAVCKRIGIHQTKQRLYYQWLRDVFKYGHEKVPRPTKEEQNAETVPYWFVDPFGTAKKSSTQDLGWKCIVTCHE
eukprot:COSAG06_NODE_50_length_28525_cov_88.227010_23_plen_205_part_00